MVSTSQKCTSCKSYQDLSDTSSHSNEHFLSTPEKKAKMSTLKQRVRVAEKQVQNLRAKIEELTQQQGDDVDANHNADLLGITMKISSNHTWRKILRGFFGKSSSKQLQ